MVKSLKFGADFLILNSDCNLVASWPQVNTLSFLNFCFLIFKVGVINILPSQRYCENEINICGTLKLVFGTWKMLSKVAIMIISCHLYCLVGRRFYLYSPQLWKSKNVNWIPTAGQAQRCMLSHSHINGNNMDSFAPRNFVHLSFIRPMTEW